MHIQLKIIINKNISNIPYSLDRLSVQIDFQEKMKTGIFEYKYNIIDKGRLRKYSFILHSDDIIETVLERLIL